MGRSPLPAGIAERKSDVARLHCPCSLGDRLTVCRADVRARNFPRTRKEDVNVHFTRIAEAELDRSHLSLSVQWQRNADENE